MRGFADRRLSSTYPPSLHKHRLASRETILEKAKNILKESLRIYRNNLKNRTFLYGENFKTEYVIKSYSALANIIHNIINESIGYTVNSIIPHILNLLRQGNYNLYVKTYMKNINFKINVNRCISRTGYFDGNIIMDIHFKN